MAEEHEHTGPVEDDEFTALRQAKFGQLPARVGEGQMVETAQANPVHEDPPEPPVRREWG